MYSFRNDYNEVCHPKVLEGLKNIEGIQFSGYGLDEICIDAKNKMKEAIDNDSDIHFLVGGTQANLVVISSLLKPYQGVISADSGHINVHETGAIEATGHKILSIKSDDGKLYANKVLEMILNHYNDANAEHTTMPGMVYISNPTELGTIYKKEELIELHDICKKYNIPLFLDGARLSYALSALNNDISLKDYKDLVDVYYIGGTKCGAMFGEAVVFNDKSISKFFRYNMKQRGSLLAKGFLLGVQFNTLFTDNLYYEIGLYANELAYKLDKSLKEMNIKMLIERSSNQLFLILPKIVIEKLKEKYSFELWQEIDEFNSCIRIVVSWATKKEKISEFISDLASVK